MGFGSRGGFGGVGVAPPCAVTLTGKHVAGPGSAATATPASAYVEVVGPGEGVTAEVTSSYTTTVV
mgnify:CR=1 FL=1